MTILSNLTRKTLVKEVTEIPKTLTELQSPLAAIGDIATSRTASAAFHRSGMYDRVAKRKPLPEKEKKGNSLEFIETHMKDLESMNQKILWWEKKNSFAVMQNAVYGRNWAQPSNTMPAMRHITLLSAAGTGRLRDRGNMNGAKYRQTLVENFKVPKALDWGDS